MVMYLTEECNLRCTYCFVEKRPRRMSPETALRTVDLFMERDVAGSEYRLQLSLFGGEPFLEVELIDQVGHHARRQARARGRRVLLSATTNGTLLDSRVEDTIRNHRIHIVLSMDGDSEVTARDRPFLGGRSSHRAVERNLPRFVEVAPDVLVRTTFHPGALDLVGRVRYLLALGAPRIALCPVMDWPWEGRGEAVERAYEDLGEWFLANSSPTGIPPLDVTRRLLSAWHRSLRGGARPRRPCRVGHSLLSVDPDGNVMPCHRFLGRPEDRLGTVIRPEVHSERRRPFVELDSSRMQGCDGCTAEPVCGGGCRVVALKHGRGLDDPDPGHCIPMRATCAWSNASTPTSRRRDG